MPWHVTPDAASYERGREIFDWDVPEGYNIAWDLVRKHVSRKSHSDRREQRSRWVSPTGSRRFM